MLVPVSQAVSIPVDVKQCDTINCDKVSDEFLFPVSTIPGQKYSMPHRDKNLRIMISPHSSAHSSLPQIGHPSQVTLALSLSIERNQHSKTYQSFFFIDLTLFLFSCGEEAEIGQYLSLITLYIAEKRTDSLRRSSGNEKSKMQVGSQSSLRL
eukprot:scaffold74137_cov49-Cyclotella_meneghiniana.AAC.1